MKGAFKHAPVECFPAGVPGPTLSDASFYAGACQQRGCYLFSYAGGIIRAALFLSAVFLKKSAVSPPVLGCCLNKAQNCFWPKTKVCSLFFESLSRCNN